MAEDYIQNGLGKPDWIKDPVTGELLPIEKDQSWREALNPFYESECKHEHTKPMRVKIADGRTQVMRCCINCGDRNGSPLSQKDRVWVDALDWLPDELVEGYRSRRSREKSRILLEVARQQYTERGRFTQEYREYLASPQWRERRARIMQRCGGICEGCGERKAVEVHHLTYRHFTEEFLFELVGMCAPCHDRYHSLDEAHEERAT